MQKHPVTEAYIKSIKQALKMFGEHSFYDKGADEVMDINTKPIEKLPQVERVKVIKELMAYKHGQNLCAAFGEFDKLSEAEAGELITLIEGA